LAIREERGKRKGRDRQTNRWPAIREKKDRKEGEKGERRGKGGESETDKQIK
jgi:hypothetical protein